MTTQPEPRGRGEPDLGLLSICALLRWFDRDLLVVLAERGDDEVGALLDNDLVESAVGMAGAWRLRDDARAAALARLRAERPSDELTWQNRFFAHFLSEMRETALEERRAAAEDECMHHLGELFLMIAARHEWQLLSDHVAASRAARPRRSHHLARLSFYEGYVAVRTQDYERGEAILSELLEREELADGLRVEVLNALGQIYWFQTRYDQALDFYEQVQSLAQATANRFYQAAALTNIAMIYQELGNYERAVDFATQGLAIYKELGDGYRAAQTLYEIGNYAMWLGRWQDAQIHFRQAVALYKVLGVQAGLAYLYWGQGFIHLMLHEQEESEDAFNKSLELSQLPDHEQPSLTMDSWILLGLLYQTQDRWSNALSAYQHAAELAERLGNQHWLSLIHYRRGNVFERQGRPDEALVEYRQAIEGIEALRGATRAEEIKIGLLGTVQQVYESTVRLCLARGQDDLAFEYVERARSRAFLDMLAERHPELHEEVARPVAALAEVRAALPEGALLVEYYTTGVLPRGEALINRIPPENARLREHLALPPAVVGFAVTRDGLRVFYPDLDPNLLRPLPGDPGPGRRLLRERLLTHLYEQLIAPVSDLLAAARLLYLAPHGPLHYVPFMALRSAAGAHLLHAAGPAIALAPSATVLLRSCLDRPRLAEQGLGVLALGFNDDEEDPLRYAEAEAAHVARLAGGAMLAGPEPKRDRLADLGRRARWLHFAGHAIYDPHDPLGSYLKLGQGDQLTARQIIDELELSCELVTLSACMSGVTHVVPGDELLGLQRALLYAGAPAVVCALWEAADLVALLVMDRFYRALRAGHAPGGALRDAQIAVRAMTGRDLLATLERWRAEDPDFVGALGELPEIPAEALDEPIYSDPSFWATFMLIGRAD